jgi:L-ascorbate metabolism protein UlaG (beta-lactamase superfamily)
VGGDALALKKRKKRRWSTPLRILGAALLALLLGALVSTERFAAFGAPPIGERLARIQRSFHFVDGAFQNLEPTELMKVGMWTTTRHWLDGDEQRRPTCPLPVVASARALAEPPSSGLRVTWLGHSTTLIEIDGAIVLTDPQWSDRASPSRWIGPRRFHPPPLAIADLPRIDAVLISHEHFDHLDMATVRALAARGAVFHVPLGIGAHLAHWGVTDAQVRELDWWDRIRLDTGVELVATPARHFNGRGVPWRIGTSWTSWAIVGPRHRAYFSGDTGLTETFRETARREGPFDVAMLEIGQYHEDWGDIHLGPLGALEATKMLDAKVLLPIHWATFELAYHGWSAPAEMLVREAPARGVAVVTPRLGEPVEPTEHARTTPWWQALPAVGQRCSVP